MENHCKQNRKQNGRQNRHPKQDDSQKKFLCLSMRRYKPSKIYGYPKQQGHFRNPPQGENAHHIKQNETGAQLSRSF